MGKWTKGLWSAAKPKKAIAYASGPSHASGHEMFKVENILIVDDYEDWGFTEDGAQLVAEAFNTAHETGLTPRQLAEQRAELLEALKHTARVLADWHKTDFNEIVADGGVAASDVIRQECGWHSARLLKAIANAERKP